MPHKPHHQRQHASLSLSIPGLLEVSGWFAELDADAQARVLDEMREQHVAAGAALCRRGETPLHWYGTLEGLLELVITSDDGRSVTFGGLSDRRLGRRGHAAARSAAQRPTSSRCATAGWRCCRSRPRVAAPHATELQPLPAGADQRAAALVHRQLRGPAAAGHRAARWRRAIAGLFHPWLHPLGQAHLETSQEEIANLSGLSRQRCNAALNRLRAAGCCRSSTGGSPWSTWKGCGGSWTRSEGPAGFLDLVGRTRAACALASTARRTRAMCSRNVYASLATRAGVLICSALCVIRSSSASHCCDGQDAGAGGQIAFQQRQLDIAPIDVQAHPPAEQPRQQVAQWHHQDQQRHQQDDQALDVRGDEERQVALQDGGAETVVAVRVDGDRQVDLRGVRKFAVGLEIACAPCTSRAASSSKLTIGGDRPSRETSMAFVPIIRTASAGMCCSRSTSRSAATAA